MYQQKHSSWSKTRNIPGRISNGLELGTGGAVASDYKNPAILIVQGYGYQFKAPAFLICDVLEIHCVLFVQHCLISFPLISLPLRNTCI